MKGKRRIKNENALGFLDTILIIGVIILLIGLIGIFVYFFYVNIPGNPQKLNFQIENNKITNISLGEVKQFYPNMKFNHNTISYNIDSNCQSDKSERMISAFNYISNSVGVINFIENSNIDMADIFISCSANEKLSEDNKDYFIAGEGGAREIIQTGKYNVINQGLVLLYNNGNKNTLNCAEPNVEIHEIMHVFGFNHSPDQKSLMYPLLESCNQKLDSSIINELKRLYSEENLPELYFDDVVAVKKGRYLDFNITIRNAGDINAVNVDYSIFDDGELAEKKTIDEIKYGAGIVINVENFKLIHRDPSEIKFVIDSNNNIKEYDKSNNIALVKLTG